MQTVIQSNEPKAFRACLGTGSATVLSFDDLPAALTETIDGIMAMTCEFAGIGLLEHELLVAELVFKDLVMLNHFARTVAAEDDFSLLLASLPTHTLKVSEKIARLRHIFLTTLIFTTAQDQSVDQTLIQGRLKEVAESFH